MSISIKTESEEPAGKPEPTVLEDNDDEICELEHLRKLFIGGLAPYTTEESLKTFYGQWGKVVDVVVMRDPNTKRSRGFGFITYTKAYMVDKAQDNRPHVIDGKTVDTKRALPRPERESRETNISVKKLFVGGLKDNHDEACLQDYFTQFGNVVSVKILTDKTTGKRRGFAFIEFDDYDAVDKAVLQKSHSIKYVVVDVKKSIYNHDEHKNRPQSNSNITITNPTHPSKQPQGAMPLKGNYRPPPPPQGMPPPPYQQQPPMNGGPVQPPPPNYNYWGPPPPMPQQYGGYQQPPPPPQQMNQWNYQPPPNAWNAGPPPPPQASANAWYQNQWGYPPPVGPPPVAPMPNGAPPPSAGSWSAPSAQVATAPVPPPVASGAVPPPQQQPPPNFGAGYQQSYSGGPTKHNMTTNRVNPYNVPVASSANYAGNPAPPPAAGAYGSYKAGPPNGAAPSVPPAANGAKPVANGSAAIQPVGNNKYRR